MKAEKITAAGDVRADRVVWMTAFNKLTSKRPCGYCVELVKPGVIELTVFKRGKNAALRMTEQQAKFLGELLSDLDRSDKEIRRLCRDPSA